MPLHDILPPLEIADYFWAYLAMALLVMLGVLGLLIPYLLKKKKAISPVTILEQCDFNDAKKTSLQFSHYGKTIFTDALTKPKFVALEEKIKKYKYIQHMTPLPKALEDDIKKLLKEKRDNHA